MFVHRNSGLGVGENQFRITEVGNGHGVLGAGFEEGTFISAAGLDDAVRVQDAVFIQGDEAADCAVVANDFLLGGFLSALGQDLHMLDVLQEIGDDVVN